MGETVDIYGFMFTNVMHSFQMLDEIVFSWPIFLSILALPKGATVHRGFSVRGNHLVYGLKVSI